MSASNSNVTVTNIPLGPMRVTFNGVDLGATEGGVNLSVKTKLADIKLDQFGDTPADAAVAGQTFEVKFTLCEIVNKAIWKAAFPHGKLIGTSPQSFYFDMTTGDRVSSQAHVLLLHPLFNLDSDLSGDYKIFKAVAKSASEIKYGPDKQTGLSVDIMVLPDTTTIPARFLIHGDPTIGIVDASAGAAVAGSNTGNGTITSIVPTNAGTKTETISVVCVGASGGNDFAVSGSVSGALGTFHIAATAAATHTFSNAACSFLMTQGATQFVYNDSFTISTVAANYA